MIDHDRLFKELLTAFFVEFLELFLPALASDIDRDSLAFLDKEIFTDVTSGERHEVDVLARVRWRGRDSSFLIHVENQAQQQSDFPVRMFHYFARLLEKHRLPVYPIAVFSHDSEISVPGRFELLFNELEVLRFNFRVIQLRRLSWREFVRQPNPVAAALMTRMGMAPEERPRVKLECLRLLTTLKLDPARQRLISGFIDTYLRLTEAEALQFNRESDTILTRDEKERVMELTTSWEEKGRQQGQAEVVLRQLRRRCGQLAAPLEAQVKALPSERLESLAEDLLDFASIPDLERWLELH